MSAKLTLKQARFVEQYLVHGNALQAATEAGYKSPHPEGARLLRNATVAAFIAKGRKVETKRAQMDREARIAWYEKKASEAVRDGDQIRAMELLSKMHGDFTEHVKTEHVGPVVHVICTPEERRERLKKGSR